MAKAKSFDKHAARLILKEHFRELEKYKNDVDLEKSGMNYHFGITNNAKECMEKIQRRVNEIMQGRDIPKNTNLMSSWVVSLPENLPKDKTDDFFQFVYDFFSDRYGKDNVIDGFVHLDETTPHIHVCFVPEAVSRKSHKQTVSSASLLTRSELPGCQADLEKVCRERYGIKNLILNGKTKGGVSLEKLKAETAKEQAVKAEKRVAEAEERLQELQQENDRLLQENTDLFTENNELKEENYIIRMKNTNYQLERFRNSVKNKEKVADKLADKLSDGIAEKARKLDEIANMPRKSKQSRQERYTEQAEQIIGKPSLPSDFSPVY